MKILTSIPSGQDNEKPDIQPDVTIVKLTPTWADALAVCPLRFFHTMIRRDVSQLASPALARGTIIHQAMAIYNRMLLRGDSPPDIDTFVLGLWPPRLRDQATENTATLAGKCLYGYAQFLQSRRLVVRGVEQFVTIPPRRLANDPTLAVALSGKIDVLLQDPDGALIACDVKTGNTLSLDMVGLPSTAIYIMLAQWSHPDAAVVRVARLLPHMGVYQDAELSDVQLEAARAALRPLLSALAHGRHDPVPGEECPYCPVLAASACPAHERGTDTSTLF